MPKISVVMPAYNAEKYIKEAIDSILGQTFGDFELIIINDCSTDSTENIILSYSDSRIVYLKNEKNMGVAATLNRGLQAARGEYIARMDSDDIALSQRLEKQLQHMKRNGDVIVCGSNFIPFHDSGDLPVSCVPEEDGQIKTFLLFGSPFAHPTVMIRASVLKETGLCYDVAYEKVEDYYFWMQLSRCGKFANLNEPLLRYRNHSQQVSVTAAQIQHEGKYRIALQQLPEAGIRNKTDIETFVNAYDRRIDNTEQFRNFENLAVRLFADRLQVPDVKYFYTMLKSQLIEYALELGMRLRCKSVRLVGIKAWLYTNWAAIGGKK